jgi:hypothetical protein
MYTKIPTAARVVNGWQMSTDTMGVYGDYYLRRAFVAMVVLGANQPDDATYPINLADAHGKPLLEGVQILLHHRLISSVVRGWIFARNPLRPAPEQSPSQFRVGPRPQSDR